MTELTVSTISRTLQSPAYSTYTVAVLNYRSGPIALLAAPI